MRRFALLGASSLVLLIVWFAPSVADAAFTQCPAVGSDASCQFLITVTDKGVQVAQDPGQGPFDGEDDALIGIQNSSSKAVASIPLSAENSLFGFELDGICSPRSPVAPGCVVLEKDALGNASEHPGASCPPETSPCGYPPPSGEPANNTFPAGIEPVGFGANGDAVSGYEGPTSWFSNIASPLPNSGVVNFSPALAPGASTYFSLESPPTGKTIVVGSASTVTTVLSGAGQSGTSITVAQGTPVTDSATIGGTAGPSATGEVTYAVYRDATCKTLAAQAGGAPVTAGVAGASAPQRLAPGTYYWLATYSGDINNQAAASACGSEKLVVARKASLGLPPSNKCFSKRHFVVHPRAPRHVRLVHVEVFINGKRVHSGALSRRHTFVDLRGLPKGTFRVLLVTTASNGKSFADTRTYHTCVRGKHKKLK
jgi:hypothetical protein